MEDQKIEVTEEEQLVFFKTVILDQERYTETYTLFDTEVVFQTRTGEERNFITEKIAEAENNSLIIVRTRGDAVLATSLVKFGDQDFSKLTLSERYDKIIKMPAAKIELLWRMISRFDAKVEELTNVHINF